MSLFRICHSLDQYINTYWAIPILGFAQILAIPIHPFIQYRIAQYGMRPWWKGTPGFSKGESWIPAGTRGTLGSRSCRRVPLESDVNFQLKQSNRGFSFSASHLIWILASPPGIAGFRAGRPAARNPAEVVTSVLLGTHEHTRKTNCLISADQALHPVRT